MYIYICIYIYVYMYIYICIYHMCRHAHVPAAACVWWRDGRAGTPVVSLCVRHKTRSKRNSDMNTIHNNTIRTKICRIP